MAEGLNAEFEKLGMVAMIAALLIPGMVWVMKAKSTPAMLGRATLLSGLILGAVRVEGSMDQSAEELAN